MIFKKRKILWLSKPKFKASFERFEEPSGVSVCHYCKYRRKCRPGSLELYCNMVNNYDYMTKYVYIPIEL